MAARTKAPESSTIIFILSWKSWAASIISPSYTRMISVRRVLRKEKVMSPILVLTPSARVKGGYWGWILSFSIDSLASLAKQGSTPITFTLLFNLWVATRLPLHSPPPPTGTTRQSRSCIYSYISNAQVAAPVMICRSLQGCINVAPVSRAILLLSLSWSDTVGPDSTISAPYPWTAFFLIMGVSRGMTILALRPSWLLIQATA